MDSDVNKSWEEFLNPQLLRARLLAASIYIAGYGALKDAIVDRLRSFFSFGAGEAGDTIDPKYQSTVLCRNRSPVHASLDWLKEMRAINDADIGAFDRVKTCRNILAHRLLETLATGGVPPDYEQCFHEMVALLQKIEVWWIKEFEIPANPDYDGEQINETDIQSGRVLGLQLMCEIALGDEKKSGSYFEQFAKGKSR